MPVKPKVPKKAVDLPAPPDSDDVSELVEIDFQSTTFVIPRDRDDWSIEALAYLSEGKYNPFVKYLLDTTKPGQWKALVQLCPTRKDFSAFFILIGKVIAEECTG